MKKTILGLFLGLSIISLGANEVRKDEEVKADLHVNINVLAPLTIEETLSLEFGDAIIGEDRNAIQKGNMEITGALNNVVYIYYPNTMTVRKIGDYDKAINVKLAHPKENVYRTLGGDGKYNEVIDGSIDAEQIKHVGNYTGVVSISVKYN